MLVVFEVYDDESGEPYFSSLLQPVEWFAQRQNLLLSHSLIPQVEQYYITLSIIAPTKSYDLKNIQKQSETEEGMVSLSEYFHTSVINSYS